VPTDYPSPDTTSTEELQKLSGLELLQGLLDGRLPAPAIGYTLEFNIVEVERGRVVFAGIPNERFLNPLGTVHGGYAATLLDSCMGCAVHSTLESGQGYTTVELKINYVRPITPQTGLVRAEGRVIHPGRQIATADGRLIDAQGKLLAHGTTTCIIFAARS
jgi:uncharacterized protein (TIGR00369 family)